MPQEWLCRQWDGGLCHLGRGKQGSLVFHVAANPQHPQEHGSTRVWVQGTRSLGFLSPSPPGYIYSPYRSSTWRGLGAALPSGSRIYGKQQILPVQMGKFQGIVSEFLAAVLGSRWPGAPEKCGCLLQMETWVGLTWLCSFHLTFKTQWGPGGAGSGGEIMPQLFQSTQVTQYYHHGPRGIKFDFIFSRSSCP